MRGLGVGSDSRFPIPDSRFPFPSWEGLGVGSDSRFPFPSWEGLGAHRGRFFTKGRVRTFIVKYQSTSGGNIVKYQSASGVNHGSSIKTMMINNDKLSTLS
ncbi:hypothetical protein BJP36_43565 [Moorena producens JHB]|uniref:Uncharacterized protein n=1 Tax=Moorena producens (strain JHB) TaxID=1454205 RepID=A0A9Q9STC9_MOOP1|nr:hypothetical protein [Moorena producens]WAN69242.1 hypothetical protein BJP36_43565 [Moorena producens JHB]